MSAPRQQTRQAIQERRRASGLGVACPEAQADGVPCGDIRDCDNCDQAAREARGAEATASASAGRKRRART